MTYTKQIKILDSYIESGKSETVVLIYKDRWNNKQDRDKFTLGDVAEQFKQKSGFLYDFFFSTAEFRNLCKIVDDNEPLVSVVEYEDTKQKFFDEHPDYYEKNHRKWLAFNSIINREMRNMPSVYA